MHNRYRRPGGEERYVEELWALLGRHGAAAGLVERDSESAGRARAAAGLIRGGLDAEAVGRSVAEAGATVVHAHNIHPALGWRALAAAREAGAAVVLHLHNYRLFCAVGIAFRDGHDCLECAPRKTVNGLRHNCRGSAAEAAAYAIGLRRAQPRLADLVDVFVSPTDQLARDLAEAGLDLAIETLPTWLAPAGIARRSHCGDGEYGLFVGRVTEEKGIFTAIEAAAKSRVGLRVAGDGPALPAAVRIARELDAPVEFLGHIDGQAIVAARLGAAFCVLPSLWREVLPFSALEALGGGLPLVVSRRGGLPELTDPELVFTPGDSDQLADLMRQLIDDRARRTAAGDRALERVSARHGEEIFGRRLAEIYATAAGRRAAGPR